MRLSRLGRYAADLNDCAVIGCTDCRMRLNLTIIRFYALELSDCAVMRCV